MALFPGILKTLFSFETNPLRFEDLCIDLYYEAEGVNLVPTSRTWDQGRDARSISSYSSEQDFGHVLCATLSSDLDAKVEEDIRHLAKTSKTKSIIYCTSHELSEHACDRLN